MFSGEFIGWNCQTEYDPRSHGTLPDETFSVHNSTYTGGGRRDPPSYKTNPPSYKSEEGEGNIYTKRSGGVTKKSSYKKNWEQEHDRQRMESEWSYQRSEDSLR